MRTGWLREEIFPKAACLSRLGTKHRTPNKPLSPKVLSFSLAFVGMQCEGCAFESSVIPKSDMKMQLLRALERQRNKPQQIFDPIITPSPPLLLLGRDGGGMVIKIAGFQRSWKRIEEVGPQYGSVTVPEVKVPTGRACAAEMFPEATPVHTCQ